MSSPGKTAEQRAARRVGAVLRDKYTLERVLGVGGMAAVYLGVHRNGHRVAVKVLHPELSVDDDVRARFLREGYVANSIGHRGAVRVLDDDVAEDGSAFLVMELLEGETLDRRARRRGGRLQPREALSFAHQLLDVLASAHDKGVVHRDVKPENLFLVRGEGLKVLDFGIARVRDASGAAGTWAGSRMGTPAFMPPEQALGRAEEVGARSDVWGVGATLFSLLSGHFVHEADTVAEVVVRAATVPPRSLAEVAPQVPAPVVALVDRALAFWPEDRWPDARAMQRAVAETYASLFGEPVSGAEITEDSAAPTDPAPPLVPGPSPRRAHAEAAPTLPAAGEPTSAREPLPAAPTLPAAGAGPSQPAPPDSPTEPSLDTLAPSRSTPRVPSDVPPSAGPPPTRRFSRPAVAVLVALAAAIGTAAGLSARSPRPSAAGVPASADPRPGCTTNRACVASAGGQAAVCHKDTGVCVALGSEDCRVLAEPGDLENDATVWIGAMFPTGGPNAPDWGPRSMNAVDLARRDFAETAGGLPPARPGGPRRPLAVVACDDAVQAARAAAHLVDEVRVPAIVGFARSKEVIDLAGSLFVPRGVLALAANTATMLRSIPRPEGGPRLVWRTTTSVDMVMAPRTALVAEVLEPAVRAAPGALRPGEPMRIALVRVNNPSGLSYADIVISSLRWNGRGVIENGDAFRQFAVPDSLSEELDDDARARFAAEIAAFAPHLVLDGGGLDGRFIQSVERAWPKGRPSAPPPRYVMGELAAPNILELLRAQPDVRGRVFGVDTVTSTPAMGKFVLRYNEVFTPKITGRETAGAPYDAVYALAYAAAALGAEPVTGPALARALGRLLPPGEPIDVGPGGIYPALAALGSGKNVDLVGTVTSLDFDPETGDATADFAVYCIGPTSFGDARDVVASGLVYDARARALRGTMRCGPAPNGGVVR